MIKGRRFTLYISSRHENLRRHKQSLTSVAYTSSMQHGSFTSNVHLARVYKVKREIELDKKFKFRKFTLHELHMNVGMLWSLRHAWLKTSYIVCY